MRRIHMISTVALILVRVILADSQTRPPSSQTVQATTARRIHVDAPPISGLPTLLNLRSRCKRKAWGVNPRNYGTNERARECGRELEELSPVSTSYQS